MPSDRRFRARSSGRATRALTPVQQAVLDPALAGRDLRISSQTGSGQDGRGRLRAPRVVVERRPPRRAARPGAPRALVVAPTRELAKQVEEELAWLYAPLGARVASVTGGGELPRRAARARAGPRSSSARRAGCSITSRRGAIDASEVAAIVLDEADRMLDLGFREELEAILEHAPRGASNAPGFGHVPARGSRARRPRAERTRRTSRGRKLGAANTDIEHVIHLVDPAAARSTRSSTCCSRRPTRRRSCSRGRAPTSREMTRELSRRRVSR